MSPLDKPIAFTLFKSQKARTKSEKELTLRALKREIVETQRDAKSRLPWLLPARFGHTRSDNAALRHDANVLARTGVCLDCDGGPYSIGEARALFKEHGIAALLYDSPSAQTKPNRWRAVFPFSREMGREDYSAHVERLAAFMPGLDMKPTRGLSTSYYFGGVGDWTPRVFLIDGAHVDKVRLPTRESEAPTKDESGSGALYRLALECVGEMERAAFYDAVADDAEASAHVARQKDGDRAMNRAWAKAMIHKLAREHKAAGDANGVFLGNLYSASSIDGVLSKEELNREAGKAWKAAPESAFDDLGDDDSPLEIALYAWPDPAEIPRRDFIAGRAYIRGYVSATIAPGGAGKSALTITEALAMASGKPLLGYRIAKPSRVLLWNLEDDQAEMDRRFAAARQHYAADLKGSGFERRLFVKSASDGLSLAMSTRDGVKLNTRKIKSLIAALRAAQIDALIVDPFVSAHGVTENDNDEIDRVVKLAFARIAREVDCAVMLVHHVRKAGAGQSEYRVEDSRGASALVNACRYARVLNRMSEKEARELGVDDGARWRFIRVDDGKANLAPPAGATWRELAEVTLPNSSSFEANNGDRIGIAISWTPPDIGRTTITERERIVTEMAGEDWRADVRAKDWVGRPIGAACGLDIEDPRDRAEVKARIKDGLARGWLKEIAKADARREKRRYIVARAFRSKEEMLGL